MSTLVAVLLVTQTDQGQPALTFAWPPRPQVTPRLDRPVYKLEQSLAGDAVRPLKSHHSAATRRAPRRHGEPPSSSEGDDDDDEHGHSLRSRYPVTDEDLTGMRFIRGLRAPGGSSSEEDSPRIGTRELERFEATSAALQRLGARRRLLTPIRSASIQPAGADDEEDHAAPMSFYHSRRHKTTSKSQEPSSGNLYLGFSDETWTDLLSPRDGRGKKLEVVVDALAIIGHPVWVKQERRASQPLNDLATQLERGRSRTRASNEEDEVSNVGDTIADSVATLTNSGRTRYQSVERSVTAPATTVSELTRMLSLPSQDTHPGISSRSASTSSAQGRSTGPSPISSPILTPKPLQQPFQPFGGPVGARASSGRRPKSNEGEVNVNNAANKVSCFTLALVIDTPPASHLSQHLDVYYRDVVLKLTAALKRLERLHGYISREATACHSIKSPTDTGSWAQVLEQREQRSALAQELAIMFDELKEKGEASGTFDERLDLELLLHSELLQDVEELDESMAILNVHSTADEVDAEEKWKHLLGWKTLLPIYDDSEALAEGMPSNSLLAKFLSMLTPTLTLSEYQTLLDTDAAAMIEMADHLLYWRKARLIDVVSLKHFYQVSSSTLQQHSMVGTPNRQRQLLHSILELSIEFSKEFPGFPSLPSILGRISTLSTNQLQPFSTVLPSLSKHFIIDKSSSLSVLIWLLRHDLVARVRTYVRVKVRSEIKRQTKQKLMAGLLQTTGGGGSSGKGDDDSDSSRAAPSLSASPETFQRPALTQFAQMRFTSSSYTHQMKDDHQPSSVDSGVEIRFSPAIPLPSPIGPLIPLHSVAEEAAQSGFSLHPSSYPRLRSASRSSSLTRLENLRGDSVAQSNQKEPNSPGSSPGGMGMHPRAHSASQRRWKFRSSGRGSLASSTSESIGTGLAAGDDDDDDEEWETESSIIPDPGRALALERKWLEEIGLGKAATVRSHFSAAVRYFDGHFTLEEIVSRTGIGKRALKTVLQEYQDDLILVMHP